MSSDLHQMLRSYDIVMSEFAVLYPERKADLAFGRACLIDWLATRAARMGRVGDFLSMMIELAKHDPVFASKSIFWSYLRPLARKVRQVIKTFLRHPTGFLEQRRKETLAFLGPEGSPALWQRSADNLTSGVEGL
ncbi:MAG: hypothetical protein R3C04_11595 [Hyphomonas sp.]